MALLDNLFLTQKLVLYLSGDLHNYRHHVLAPKEQQPKVDKLNSQKGARPAWTLGGGADDEVVHKVGCK
jgi:hypothetical protein